VKKRLRTILLILVFLFVVWVAVDLFAPLRGSLKTFSPAAVAKLETDMWRSYYERKPLRLFIQLSELLRTQYHLPLFRSMTVSYQATRAAFVFKKGHNRHDYEKALPYLGRYYKAIRKAGDIPFDVERAAKTELEWWIVHRERKKHTAEDLGHALAEATAEIYRMPAEKFLQHAQLKAEAMLLRSKLAEEGNVTETDWNQIQQLLDASWQSHWTSLH
jgi:hypothetical protein